MLKYDDSWMLLEGHGQTDAELATAWTTLKPVAEAVSRGEKPSPGYDFIDLSTNWQTLETVSNLVKELQTAYDTVLVLAIGGSDLGARAVSQAILHPFHNNLAAPERRGMKLYFSGANTDPHQLETILSQLDWHKTVINVISKSGETIETMSAFLICQAELEKAVGHDQAADQVVVTTGKTGTLRTIAEREGYRTLTVPSTIGGRFSILSTVGLFPLAAAGIDIQQLLAGAEQMSKQLTVELPDHPAVRYALHHYVGNTAHNRSQAILMPYAESLVGFSLWYRQLWAESLGKAKDLDGNVVAVGQTPIASLGATDQHSQIQLYIEGPHDKLITFIVTEKCRADQIVPGSYPDLPALAYLGGKAMSQLLATEHSATARALMEHDRPNGTIRLGYIDEEHIGQLIMMFELAASFSGVLYNIDPFNQPGVDHGKRHIEAILKGDE